MLLEIRLALKSNKLTHKFNCHKPEYRLSYLLFNDIEIRKKLPIYTIS